MADGLREFPPSDLKLSRLRASGILPVSRELLTFAVILAVPFAFGAMYVLAELVMFDFAEELFSGAAAGGAEAADQAKERIKDVVGILLQLAGACAGVVALSVIFVGAIQNRFLLTLAPLGFNFGRLLSFGEFSLSEIGDRLLGALSRLALSLLIAAGAVLVMRRIVFQWAATDSLIQSGGGMPLEWSGIALAGGELLIWLALCCSAAALIAGVISRVIVVAAFRRSHRMTRAEVEAESREIEASPEFRSARRGLLT